MSAQIYRRTPVQWTPARITAMGILMLNGILCWLGAMRACSHAARGKQQPR